MELEEKLKVVAEYDDRLSTDKYLQKRYRDKNVWTGTMDRQLGNVYGLNSLRYHTSFDWSVPVYSKCIKELHETIKPFTEAAGVLVALEQRAERAIQNNDKIAFFENLYNLITELQKAKQ